MKQWFVTAALALGLASAACGKVQTAPAPTVGQGTPLPTAGAAAGMFDGVVDAPAPQRTASLERKRPARAATRPVPGVQPSVPEIPFEGVKLALVHTANVVGELEPCG